MIKVENLTRKFGDITAVDDVSFEVNKGDILGFIGPNGAGKSTTMRMITGYLTPTSGKVFIDHMDMSEKEIECKAKIGYLPERAPMYMEMPVRSFLNFAADIRGMKKAERKEAVEKVIESCFLERVIKQPIGTLSKGYRQRVCFAQSILHDPEILILDEPTDGLDPNQKHEIRKIIRNFGKDKAIVLSTHILEEIDMLCSRVMLINLGKIIVNEGKKEFMKRSESMPDTFRELTLGKAK